jgi:hypothetical protein
VATEELRVAHYGVTLTATHTPFGRTALDRADIRLVEELRPVPWQVGG